jgi:tRNA(Arg) A34 adenosine deaminase TadA
MNDHSLLRRAIALAARARENGNHPFGALLVGPDGDVLAEAQNQVTVQRDPTRHAELVLVSDVARRWPPEVLAKSTLYTSTEPCAMCAGAIYWAAIGRVVYGLPESALLELTGDHADNPTLSLPCREVFARGHGDIKVTGPLLEDEARAVHEGFWGLGTTN